MALALVVVWLLLGLVVASLSHAYGADRLPHPLTFAAIFVAGGVGGSLAWEATTGRLPTCVAAGIDIGVWIGAAWAGSKLAYGGPLDRLFDHVDRPGG